MSRIASCQRGMLREHDTGGRRVAQVTRAAFPMPRRHQVTRLLRSSNIEGNNSTADFLKNSFEGLHITLRIIWRKTFGAKGHTSRAVSASPAAAE